MPRMIFVNLPVADVARAVAFYEAIGAERNPTFSDDSAACVVLSETIHVMLLSHERYRGFTDKTIADARTSSEVLNGLSAGSRAEVDATLAKVSAAGGTADPRPPQDHGFMYGRGFDDPDGHHWDVFWMDVDAFKAATGKGASS